MYTQLNLPPEMPLVALGVVIWVVAMSIAFGFYIPVLRAASRRPAAYPDIFIPTATRPETALRAPPLDGDDRLRAPAPATAPQLSVVPPAAEPALDPVPPPKDFSVLIVDDNAVNRQVMELILDSVGLAHVSVENGLEAVKAMEACPHQAVLMDLQMPVMDGFEATRRIRELQARRGDAPASIIVVSANCLYEHIYAGRDAGAAKPISATALIGELANCRAAARIAA